MSRETPKRKLIKPDLDDFYNVEDFNFNSDKLDDAVPDSRKINGKPLTEDVTLTAEDVGAPTSSDIQAEIDKIDQKKADQTQLTALAGRVTATEINKADKTTTDSLQTQVSAAQNTANSKAAATHAHTGADGTGKINYNNLTNTPEDITPNTSIVIGFQALKNANSSSVGQCVCIGDWAGQDMIDSACNIAIGQNAIEKATNGLLGNIAVGYCSLGEIRANCENNTAIGNYAGFNFLNGSPAIRLNETVCLGANSMVSGDFQVQLGGEGTTPYAYAALQLRSDPRDKRDITDLTYDAKRFILGLKPCNFAYDFREAYQGDVYISKAEYDALPKEEQEKYSIQRPDNISNDEIFDLSVQELDELIFYKHSFNAPRTGEKAGKRKHNGFLATEVKALADELGFDFAGYQDHKVNGGCDVLSLGYEEFIAPIVATIQAQQKEIDDLKSRLEALEAR